MAEVFGSDAFSPKEIAERIENVGVSKAHLPLLSMALLSVMAGAFIGLGALGFVLVQSDATLGFAAARVLGGAVFSLGLLLVVVAGAELFTGNNLLAMARADGKLSTREVLRNWLVVLAGTLVGAVGLATLVALAHHADMNGGLIAQQYVKLAAAKCTLPVSQAFFRGILCNLLVCMAVWMAMAGRSVVDKAVALFLPVTIFVAAGFEHSVANFYLIAMGLLLKDTVPLGTPHLDALTWPNLLVSQAPVIAGNLVGGSVLVALVYFVIYRRGAKA